MMIQENSERYVPLRAISNSKERLSRKEDMMDYVSRANHEKLHPNELHSNALHSETSSQAGGNQEARADPSAPKVVHLKKSRNSAKLQDSLQQTTAGQQSQSVVKDFIETYQTQFDQMEADIIHKDTLIAGYQAEVKTLRAELQALQAQLQQSEDCLQRLYEQQADHSRLRQEHDAIMKIRTRLEEEVRERTQRAEELERQLVAQGDVAEVRDENQGLKE